MKRQDALIATQKNLNSVQCTVAEKIRKNSKKLPFFQKSPFLGVFLDFFSNCTLQRVEVFCVVISASRRFIWAIKHPHMVIFIFRVIMVFFFNFSDTRTGLKHRISIHFKIFSVFLWHKAYKTTQSRTSVGIVPSPPPRRSSQNKTGLLYHSSHVSIVQINIIQLFSTS